MTLSALGIFSAAGAGGAAPVSDFVLIETNILTGTQASITFSNLGSFSSSYRHLQLRVTGRSTTAFSNENDSFYIRFNGDSGSNYSFHQLSGNGSSVSTGPLTSQTQINALMMSSNGAGANIFGAGVVDILDAYSTSKNKTVRSLSGVYVNTQRFAMLRSGAWLNTSSITSITVGSVDGSAVAGSRFSLYGIRG